MGATTTAVFTSIGIPWANFLSFIQTLFSQTIQFSFDILVALWPFWLGVALLGIVVGIPFVVLHFFRRRG